MAVAVIHFSARPGPAANVAFGSLLDMARFHGEPAEGEVCEACQTINARHARFCKGCDGKLPAYFATVEGDTHSSPLLSEGDGEVRRSRYALFGLIGLWGTVAAVALFLAHSPRDAGVPSRPLEHAVLPAPIERAVALVDPPAAAETARAAQGLLPVAAVPSDADAALPTATEPVAATPVPEAAAIHPRAARASSPPATKSGTVRSAGAPLAVSQCGGLNFFARAVCMNNQCARPEMRRSAQCAETVRQQRLGEARRNPKLLG